MDQPVHADHPGGLAQAHHRRGSWGKRLAPYLLSLPAVVWLALLFIVPLAIMLSLSLKTCNPASGVCYMTWSWGELPHQVSLYHSQFITSLE